MGLHLLEQNNQQDKTLMCVLGIAVPVSLSMLSSSSSTSSSGVINTPAGIFVGSLTTGLAISTSGSTTTTNSQVSLIQTQFSNVLSIPWMYNNLICKLLCLSPRLVTPNCRSA